jgi:TonB family protein
MTLKKPRVTAHILLTMSLLALAISSPIPLHAQQDEPISDKETKLVDFADLEYPPLARTALVQGVVVVRAKLDDKGRVVEATASSGAEALIPACLNNAKKWRFKPNSKSAVIIVYNFRITQEVSKSGCSHFTVEPPNFATITACAPEIQ